MNELKTKLEWYLRVIFLGPGPCLIKKEFTKFEKHWSSRNLSSYLRKFLFRFKGKSKSSENGGNRFLQNVGKSQPFFSREFKRLFKTDCPNLFDNE
jgi:hypothetical protein